MKVIKGSCQQCNAGNVPLVSAVHGLDADWPTSRIIKETISVPKIVEGFVSNFSFPADSQFWKAYRKKQLANFVDVIEFNFTDENDYITICVDCITRAYLLSKQSFREDATKLTKELEEKAHMYQEQSMKIFEENMEQL